MPTDSLHTVIANRLRDLVDIVVAEAARNPEFAQSLQEVLLSPDASSKVKAKKENPKSPQIDCAHLLQTGGSAALMEAAEQLSTAELRKLITTGHYARPRELKGMERDSLLNTLTEGVRKKLNQGLVFVNRG